MDLVAQQPSHRSPGDLPPSSSRNSASHAEAREHQRPVTDRDIPGALGGHGRHKDSCPTGARRRPWAGCLHMAASHPHWQRHPEAVKPVLGPTTPTGTLEDQAGGGSWLPPPPISDTRAHLYCLHLPRLRAPMFQEELN